MPRRSLPREEEEKDEGARCGENNILIRKNKSFAWQKKSRISRGWRFFFRCSMQTSPKFLLGAPRGVRSYCILWVEYCFRLVVAPFSQVDQEPRFSVSPFSKEKIAIFLLIRPRRCSSRGEMSGWEEMQCLFLYFGTQVHQEEGALIPKCGMLEMLKKQLVLSGTDGTLSAQVRFRVLCCSVVGYLHNFFVSSVCSLVSPFSS